MDTRESLEQEHKTEFRSVEDNRFYVSKTGQVFARNGREKPVYKNKSGYCFVTCVEGKKRRSFFVHRLVAKGWIPNPNDLPLVNHKDFNKSNNDADNLEWITHNNNIKHYVCAKNGVEYIPDPNSEGSSSAEEVIRMHETEKTCYFIMKLNKKNWYALSDEERAKIKIQMRKMANEFNAMVRVYLNYYK